jgi:hypothetical protein
VFFSPEGDITTSHEKHGIQAGVIGRACDGDNLA